MTQSPLPSQTTDSPIKANSPAIVFMVSLLLISGVTASAVGYRVKSADRDRKAQLLAAYERSGGSYETAMSPSSSTAPSNDSSLRALYTATYELNERARKIGLYATLEAMPPHTVQLALDGLERIGAKESFLATKESWQLINEARMPSASKVVLSTASRIAKRYDRPHARDVEVKLFKLLTDNRNALE